MTSMVLKRVLQKGLMQPCFEWRVAGHSARIFLVCYRCHESAEGTSYFDLYHEWVEKFRKANIPEEYESAGFITAHLLGYKTFSVIPSRDLRRSVTDREVGAFRRMGECRLARMPIQYVIGDWDFGGVNLKMAPPVFIPRPETEVLVDHVKNEISKRVKIQSSVKMLEIGCGTGAITLSLLNAMRSVSLQGVAIDASKHAVGLTKKNADHLNLSYSQNLQILHHKIGVDDDDVLMDLGPFDVVISNPPYIPTADMDNLPEEISRYEDHGALHGGRNGLDVVKAILNTCGKLLSKNGVLWMEVDSSHPRLINTLFDDWKIDSHRDMYGVARFCRFRRSSDVNAN